MDRQMDVYYSVNGSEEAKLCDFDAVNGKETYAQAAVTLEEESVVTLTVKKAANDDPILSWIAVCGKAAEQEETDYSKLQAYYDEHKDVTGNFTQM